MAEEIFDLLKITEHPKSQSVPIGGETAFKVEAWGDDLTFQWQKNGSNLKNDGNCSGTDTNTLSIRHVKKSDVGGYRCLVKNGVTDEILSMEAQLEVYDRWKPFKVTCGILVVVVIIALIGMLWWWSLNAVICGTLTNPVNGRLSHTAGTTFGKKATYTCNPGYNLVGDRTRTCQATGVWSGSAPTCQPVDCGTLTNPVNGRVSHAAGTTFTQKATYTCNTGYNLVGDRTRTCQATGVWSRSAPTCLDPPKITQHPESKSVATGASTTFTVEATGYGCRFHWKKDGKDLHEGSKYHGTKTDTLQIKDVDESDEGSYQCLVKNAANEVLSEKAELAVSHKWKKWGIIIYILLLLLLGMVWWCSQGHNRRHANNALEPREPVVALYPVKHEINDWLYSMYWQT